MFHLTSASQVWDLYITALFYVLQFGIMHAYVYFIHNQYKIQSEALLKQAALKSQLSALKAQLNPHFLYNVFNTINASIPSDLENTRQMIAELSDMFRYQLRASQVDFVELKDELEFTKKYLHLEKARFQERLNVEIYADEDLMQAHIPPMLIQPLVENAVKHGISPLIEGGKITVSVNRVNNQLLFCIADTGIGMPDKTNMLGKGTGLTNTALRLEMMYSTALAFSDTNPRGLTIKFAIG
jgi:LytS/YehU family sensor histidine kinase